MGTVLGRISVETPKYQVVAKGEGFEVREYEPCVAAEVSYDPTQMKSGRDGGFMILASYIGAVGKAHNQSVTSAGGGDAEKIAMTAPVITQEGKSSEGEKIAMTAPVLTKEEESEARSVTMQFVLPSKYTMENAPRPTDSRVRVVPVPTKKYGVVTFSGVADDNQVKQKVEFLKEKLEKAGYKLTGSHMLARYNPPWTPSFLRTNEVMLPVE